MHIPRFLRRGRTLSSLGLHPTAAGALVLILLAGLACDENALTETRAPSAPTGIDTEGDEVNGPAQGSATAMVIPLPVAQSVSTATPIAAFSITQTGTGPNASFQNTSASNAQTVLTAFTQGLGRAAWFRVQNNANASAAVDARTSGSGFAVQGIASRFGGGGSFEATDPGTNQPALRATSASLSQAAAVFSLTNSLAQGSAIRAFNNSNGPAASFSQFIGTRTRNAVEIEAQNLASGLLITQRGQGNAAKFQVFNSAATGSALELRNESGSGGALRAFGRVQIFGTLTKSAGSFEIDHPVDPEHKTLSHSFVESPDMMNVYNGNVTMDENGRATVELPAYFQALNRDFRYQLTAIGAPGPNLYVGEGVKQNRFRIAGGRPYATVSWQVTGVRQDAYANDHRIKVEEDKPAEELQTGKELVAQR